MASCEQVSFRTKRYAELYGLHGSHLGTMEYYGTHTALAARLSKQRIVSFATYIVRTYRIRRGKRVFTAVTGRLTESGRIVLGTEVIPSPEFREKYSNRKALVYQIDNLGHTHMVRTVIGDWEGVGPQDKFILVGKDKTGKTEDNGNSE